jgi:Flp pilus assembly protein TadD
MRKSELLADSCTTKAPAHGLRIAGFLRSHLTRCAILALIGFAVRMPALQGELVWDDEFLARDNPVIKSPLLILEAFRHYLFLDSLSTYYRPVQNISFILDYFLWHTNAYGFHLTNVLVHVVNGLLLYFLLRNILGTFGKLQSSTISLTAFLIALIWMVHPVHSAAIDYISGRADSLAFLFAAGGWLLFLRAQNVETKTLRLACYGMGGLSGFLALCSREVACVWLLLFLIHLVFVDRQLARKVKLVSLGCCIALLGIYAGLRQLPPQRTGPAPSHGWSPSVRAVLMLRSLGDYGRLMIWPSSLHMERTVVDPSNYRSNTSWRNSGTSEYLSIAGLLVLAFLLFKSCRSGVGQPIRIFGSAWFLVGYLPVSNLIDLSATAAEHWLYLPSVGLLIFISGCVLDVPLRYRKVSVALAGVAVIGLSIQSALRSTDWVTSRIFYQRTLAAGGTSTRLGVNLAQLYAGEGDYAKAETIYRRVLEMTPDYPIAQNNLAEVLYRQGKKAEAEAMFSTASRAAPAMRKEYPRTWIAALNLARVRHHEKDDQAALTILERARADYPDTWEIISFESELLRRTKGPAAALPLVEKFARNNWWHYRAALALGRLYAEKGDAERANAALRHASRLDIHDATALNLIAAMRVRQNRLEEACRAQRRAVARQPDQPRQYVMLSNILEKMGRTDEAQAAIAQVTRLQALANIQAVAN